MGRVTRVPAWVAAMLLWGACSQPPPFHCATDADCAWAGHQAVCESGAGYCALLDEGCPSHYRYDVSAGGGLAGLCVVIGDASTADMAADTGPLDTRVPDSRAPDGHADVQRSDSRAPDAGTPDRSAVVADARSLDEAPPDAAGPEARAPDAMLRVEAMGPPPGDTCMNPISAAAGTTYSGNASSYTDDSSGSCGGAGAPDVVYTFTNVGAHWFQSTTSAAFPVATYVQSTCGSPPSADLFCSASAAGNSVLNDYSLPSGTYYVWVDGAGAGDSGAYTFSYTLSSPVAPPSNDTCAGAAGLSFAGSPPIATAAGTTEGAGSDYALSCNPSAGPDVVYTFTLSQAQEVTAVTSAEAGEQFAEYIESGSCGGGGGAVGCQLGAVGGSATIKTYLTAGTYYVVVQAANTATLSNGSFTLTVALGPGNDTCAGPQVLTFSGGSATASGTLVGAGDDAAGTCGGTGYHDAVYQFSLGTDQRVQASVSGGGFTPTLYLESTCGMMAGEPGDGCVAGGSLDVPSLAAGTWYLWVDGGTTATDSPFTLTVNLLPVLSPSNETCSTATSITPSATWPPTYTAGDTTASRDTYATCGSPDSRDVVYGFSLASASSVIIDRAHQNYSGVTDLEPAASCGTASSSLACTSDEYVFCPNLPVGAYNVVIDGNGADGSFEIGATAGAPKSAYDYGVVTVSPPTPFSTITTSAGATKIIDDTSLDNGSATTSLPFAFTYFGNAYGAGTALTVYQSGYVSFPTSFSSVLQNVCLPTTSLAPDSIAPFWGRLAARTSPATGTVWDLVQGTAPDRTYTVEWNGFDALTSGLSLYECIDVSIQMILYESSNKIEFRYDPLDENLCGGTGGTTDPNMAVGGQETIGLQGENGTTVMVDQNTCNTAGAVIGSCNTTVHPSPCTASEGFLFVPQTGSCP